MSCDSTTLTKEEYDAVLNQVTKVLTAARGVVIASDYLIEMVGYVPERNCSCHISPPCNDCVEWSGLREAIQGIKEASSELNGVIA